MFAGRNISATHIAFASTRVMATCAVVGQGVGTAAALALRQGALPANMAADTELVHAIQQQLLRDDCHLIGCTNQDPRDLVRSAARITSSASVNDPESVRSGVTRIVTKLPAERQQAGLHRWMSRELPATLEIHWDRPVSLREVILVFDTGLHRLLTLSQADGYTQKMLWGRPQPETVRDYEISTETAEGWRSLAEVTHNHQRLRRHVFEPVESVTCLRLTLTATNGIDHARVVEVRAYA